MNIDKALKNIETGMMFRTRENGDVVKVIFRDGEIKQIFINEILVDDGSGARGENYPEFGDSDIFADDWEVAMGF
ncbi:MAG: hypothetical protein JXK94_10735 [Deltaproteobacteria bacterium]|nr:hypothetical protein [Deltaproteobacteria bacterium]